MRGFQIRIDKVIRYKGTIILGVLDFDVKVGEILNIVTGSGVVSSRVLGIAVGLDKTSAAAKSGDCVGLLFRGIAEINIGDEVRNNA